MPQDLIALLSLIGTAAGVGTSVYGLATRPSAPKPPTVSPAVKALQQLQTQNAQRQAESQQLPNVIGPTSGLANPAYDAVMSQLLAGTAGQHGSAGSTQALIRQIFGLPGTEVPFTPAGTPAGSQGTAGDINLTDFSNRVFYT